MADMWRSRSPPVPLDFDAIMDETFVLRDDGTPKPTELRSNGGSKPHVATNGQSNGINGSVGLKDQRSLSLRDNLVLFVDRCVSI